MYMVGFFSASKTKVDNAKEKMMELYRGQMNRKINITYIFKCLRNPMYYTFSEMGSHKN